MPKFICTKSETDTVPVGTILEGVHLDEYDFVLTKDSDLLDCFNKPRWDKGYPMPLVGNIWTWEEVREND